MERFRYLFNRYVAKTAIAAERLEFQEMLQSQKYDSELKSLIDSHFLNFAALENEPALGSPDQILLSVLSSTDGNKTESQKSDTIKLWSRIVAVAAAVALIVLGVYFFNYRTGKHSGIDNLVVQDIAPGTVGATLTLANGKQIKLSSAANGEIANEAGISVTKKADGQLVYEMKETNGDPNKINTLSTAKGETYQVRLPDGSVVWLNAASSLTYSTNLKSQGKRRVKLEGEGYFEIAKDKTHPFVVESKGQEVEVLGTHFNINNYADEVSIKTTLLEGSVRIAPHSGSSAVGSEIGVILKPNQQAVLQGGIIKVKPVVAEDAIAWKNGYFMFDGENLESVMTRIARWYNVQPVYEDESLKQGVFLGTISRYEKISKVLYMLERTGDIAFEIKGNKVIIKRNK